VQAIRMQGEAKPMKLAFSTNAFTGGDYTVVEAIEQIGAAQCDGMRYSACEILADKPHLWHQATAGGQFEPALEAVAAALKRAGLAISNINGNTAAGYFGEREAPPGQTFGPSFGDPEPEARAWRVEYTKRLIDAAQFLGAPNLCVTSGFLREGVPYEEAFTNTRRCLEEVLRYAEGKNVDIIIEYEPDLILGDAASTHRMIAAIDCDWLGVNFDVGHAYVCEEDILGEIRRFGRRVKGTHFEDIKNKVHYHLIPGLGELSEQFGAILDTLREIGYQGYATLELYPYSKNPLEALNKGLEWFARRRERLGVE
jgi:fructoselysine 3-epimerase